MPCRCSCPQWPDVCGAVQQEAIKLLGAMEDLHERCGALRAQAASACEPMTLVERMALAEELLGLPVEQLEAAAALMLPRQAVGLAGAAPEVRGCLATANL